jgi:hypothetical protein
MTSTPARRPRVSALASRSGPRRPQRGLEEEVQVIRAEQQHWRRRQQRNVQRRSSGSRGPRKLYPA